MLSHTEGPWLAKIEYPQLQEIAIHHFDSLRYWLGRTPTSITARAWNAPWSDYRHGSSTEALLDFEGIRVQYAGTMLSQRFAFSLSSRARTASSGPTGSASSGAATAAGCPGRCGW